MKRYRSPIAKGFTLLEVLIALAVFAVLALAISRQIANGIQVQQQLFVKAAASMIIDNELALLMIDKNWPELGVDERVITALDRQWRVTKTINSTSDSMLREVIFSVALDETSDNEVASLIVYRGHH